MAAVLWCACAVDRPPPAPSLGPWLRLDGLVIRSVEGTVELVRDGDAWRFADSSLPVDGARVRAVERAFRVAVVPIEARDAALTARALGFDDRTRLDVVAAPMDRPPVAFSVGRAEDGGAWMARGPDDPWVYAVRAPLRDLLEGGVRTWRARRLVDLEPGDVRTVAIDGAVIAERATDGGWVSSDPGDPVVELHANRLVRGLTSAIGRPLDDCAAPSPSSAVTVATASRSVTLAVGDPLVSNAWCLLVDGVPAFAVDRGVVDALRTARRSLRPGVGVDLGTQDRARRATIDDPGARPLAVPADGLERGFARALFGLRPAAGAPPALVRAASGAPSRTITVDMTSGDVHRILLWWHPEHALGLASVDGSPPFVLADSAPLRRPLDQLVAPAP